jgi:hypothetical protein
LRSIDFQTAAHQLGPVVHDVKTEALLWLDFLWQSDPVINYAQNQFLPHSLQFHHDLPRPSVFICVNDCFPSDPIKMRRGCVIADLKRRSYFQPAGRFPNFPVNQILQSDDEACRIHIHPVKRAGKTTRVDGGFIDQFGDFLYVGCVDYTVVFQAQRH